MKFVKRRNQVQTLKRNLFLSSLCIKLERLESKRDSATDSGRTARMRATGL